MEEWREIEIEVSTTGLQASPSELHAVFEVAGDHLSEVRDKHKMVMIESGTLPESHLSDIAPERRMKWIVEEMNGIAHGRGFTIPLLGASDSEISLFRSEVDGHSILKLQVNSDFIRQIPIPSDVSGINAKLENGVLKLDW